MRVEYANVGVEYANVGEPPLGKHVIGVKWLVYSYTEMVSVFCCLGLQLTSVEK